MIVFPFFFSFLFYYRTSNIRALLRSKMSMEKVKASHGCMNLLISMEASTEMS